VDPNEKGSSLATLDPHLWLNFANDDIIIQTIADAFSEKDKAGASYYRQMGYEYQNKLSALDKQYQTSLAKCGANEIVYGGHYAFGYLANRYHLKYLAAQGVSPDSEPTAQDLAKLVDQIKINKIKYVFYEELVSPKIAETLAKETGANLLLLNSAHNLSKQDFENKVSFLTIMEDNLQNLSQGLNCTKE
jgi:zinc transport system substrate-binding protein